jgi:hypothetical protein
MIRSSDATLPVSTLRRSLNAWAFSSEVISLTNSHAASGCSVAAAIPSPCEFGVA